MEEKNSQEETKVSALDRISIALEKRANIAEASFNGALEKLEQKIDNAATQLENIGNDSDEENEQADLMPAKAIEEVGPTVVIFETTKTPLINIFGTKKTLKMYSNGEITLNKTRVIFRCNRTTSMQAKDLQFYVASHGLFGKLFNRHKLYFGHRGNDAEIKGMKREELKELRELIVKHNSLLADSKRYKCWSLLKPRSWFRKEYLYVTSKGIRYELKKELAIMPYDEIRLFYDHTKLLTVGWEVFFIGDQFIFPKARVHGTFVRKVKEHLVHDKADSQKYILEPSATWRFFHPLKARKSKSPKVIVTQDVIISIEKSKAAILRFKDIDYYTFEKKHWYSKRGEVIIHGWISSIRKDQNRIKLVEISKKYISKSLWRKIEDRIESTPKEQD